MLPEGFIPFAMDGGGWSFCFDCRHDKEDPPVILWIGDNIEETAVTPIAENFDAFLKLIGTA